MKFLNLFIVSFLAVSMPAYADYHQNLSSDQIERLKTAEAQLEGVDKKSLWATIVELEKSRHPEVNLEMKEAMAKTYTDIVREFDVQTQHKKEWVYSMVCLNMAYLQFGGDQGKYGSTTELNRLIRKELVAYLPSNVLNKSGFLHSL